MNKKLLFAAMSLAALTACTDNDFESKNVANVAGESGSVQFEIINDADATTRASMDGNKIVWSATDGDLFTLYHGATTLGAVSGYENATYTASAADGKPATLTTPSMIKDGGAIMVWPVDSEFQIKPADVLALTIEADQAKDIENHIPYVSDLIAIEPYAAYSETAAPGVIPTAYKTAGKDRKYAVYMRPMASQLTVKADYNGTDATIAELYTGGSACPADGGIEPIELTGMALTTVTGNDFTTRIPVKFTAPTTAITTQWATVANNKWNQVTDFDLPAITTTDQALTLSTKCIPDAESCKFLLLPQATITSAIANAAVTVNTLYGKVYICATGSQYTTAELADAWYRYIKPATAAETYEDQTSGIKDAQGRVKTTATIANGFMQTINPLSKATVSSETSPVKGEPVGAAATRYVKTNLNYLDMSDLHIQNDKHLRDAAIVWNHIGAGNVTVLLDGDKDGDFKISQNTIKTINEINAAAALESTTRRFSVKPCQVAGEACSTIVITGGGDLQDVTFIEPNGAFLADVAFNEGESWNWKGTVKAKATGVNRFVNRGTLVNAATATLATFEPDGTTQNNIRLRNFGTWNITAGILNVQFNVTNYGTVNISKGAQYRQDGQKQNTTFSNWATTRPTRFVLNDPTMTDAAKAAFVEQIGVVNNSGVFGTVETGSFKANINNYGLIEHADVDAKTFITSNQMGGNFGTAFAENSNMMGRINLPWSNKDEENVSISAKLNQGFVSVTIDTPINPGTPSAGILTNSSFGSKVNYVIVKSGVKEVKQLDGATSNIKYLEVDMTDKSELAWNVPAAVTTKLDGLMVLSDLNIYQVSKVTVSKATYIGADMYVGGTFTNAGWSGYYGNTTTAAATKYISY